MAEKKEGSKTGSKKMLVAKNTDAPEQTNEGSTQAEAVATTAITKAKTKAKTEPAEVPATAETLAEDLISKTAKEVENITEAKAFPLVARLQNSIEQDYFMLGGVLSRIQQENWQMDKGYETFKDWVQAETGIKYRKAMYLIAIYDGLVESGVKWEQVKHLGWTKLKELASILTPENVDEWVAVAESMTVLQLIEHIKSKTAGIGGDGDNGAVSEGADEAKKTTTKTFKLHQDQRETVDAALDKAKHEGGTEHDSKALEYICIEFLTGTSKAKKLPSLKDLMAKASAEEVLNIFGEVFPKVELQAQIPEEEAAS